MDVAILGLGAVGARLARQLLSTEGIDSVVVREQDCARRDLVARSLGDRSRVDDGSYTDPVEADVVVLAGPAGTHVAQAKAFVGRSQHVVSVADAIPDIKGLLSLDRSARDNGVSLLVGAGFSPGLTCVLAAHAAARFDRVDEIHIAKVGTGGPACAVQHHRVLGHRSIDWRDGDWVERAPGSGRELCWFPDPIGAQDCYRAALPDALMLAPLFPDVHKVTARMAATRRDRLTARLPMLWPTDPEGGPGAVRVEVRGHRGQGYDATVLGAMDRPAVAAAAVGALGALWAGWGQLQRTGAGGVAEMVESIPFLAELARRGVRAAIFEGGSEVAG